VSADAAVEPSLKAHELAKAQGPIGHPLPGSPLRSVESVLQVVIMLAIGTAAGAGSFTHVHDVAAAHGQAGWLAWADAVVLELMSIASGLELRRRKRAHVSTRFPAAVMGVSVVLSLSAQVVEAEASPIGWIAAAIPALGFLVMVKIALARSVMSAEETKMLMRSPRCPIRRERQYQGTGRRMRWLSSCFRLLGLPLRRCWASGVG
jgi:hypothetical protein